MDVCCHVRALTRFLMIASECRIFSNYSATLILVPGLYFNYSFAPIERQIQIGIIFFWRLSK